MIQCRQLVTKLQAGQPMVQILVVTRDFSLHKNIQSASGTNTASYFIGIFFLSWV
jgi:hypothetical protein